MFSNVNNLALDNEKLLLAEEPELAYFWSATYEAHGGNRVKKLASFEKQTDRTPLYAVLTSEKEKDVPGQSTSDPSPEPSTSLSYEFSFTHRGEQYPRTSDTSGEAVKMSINA